MFALYWNDNLITKRTYFAHCCLAALELGMAYPDGAACKLCDGVKIVDVEDIDDRLEALAARKKKGAK